MKGLTKQQCVGKVLKRGRGLKTEIVVFKFIVVGTKY